MVKNAPNAPLRASVLGMDGRLLATFKYFLQGPCKNQAVLVTDQSAEIIVVDFDSRNASELLAREREKFPARPIIVTSLRSPDLNGAIYVAKPIKAVAMLAALDQARKMLADAASALAKQPVHKDDQGGAVISEPIRKKTSIQHPYKRRSTHQTAMLLDERAYSSYVGMVEDINFKNPLQVAKAHYDKKKYLQAYVESAVNLARTHKRIFQLNCGWKPITIFPQSNEVWVDADDKQIRSFCVVPVGSIMDFNDSGVTSSRRSIITPVSADRIDTDRNPKNFQSIDAFLWKIALWTSNGRVPDGILFDQPVYLSRWPNLSRLVVIPHALRIAALLIIRPITLPEVATALQIRHQYVFSFFSASMALGLAGQSRRRNDPVEVVAPREIKQRTSLLQKILNRLRIG